MPITKEELQERAQLVRIHEANCRIEYPSVEEANFRVATMKRLGLALGLREVRQLAVAGPANAATLPRRPVQGMEKK